MLPRAVLAIFFHNLYKPYLAYPTNHDFWCKIRYDRDTKTTKRFSVI